MFLHNSLYSSLFCIGHKLGTFCVEGPEPRPEGLSDAERAKLHEYAAKAMELMVERRRILRDRLSGQAISAELTRHAAVTTNLGDILVKQNDLHTAMKLYQESVQTIMYVEQDGQGARPSRERQEALAQYLALLQVAPDNRDLLAKVAAVYKDTSSDTTTVATPSKRQAFPDSLVSAPNSTPRRVPCRH